MSLRCCGVLQCGAVVALYVAVFACMLQCSHACCSVRMHVAVFACMLQCSHANHSDSHQNVIMHHIVRMHHNMIMPRHECALVMHYQVHTHAHDNASQVHTRDEHL